jgi:hypothetical protein
MSEELDPTPPTTDLPQRPQMFAEPPQEKAFPATALGIAVVALLLLGAALFMLARKPTAQAGNAAYAPNLSVTAIQMSEADSQTGGKLIYIDGRITNHGAATVTAVRAQLSFANDQAMPAQIETVPMTVIYMREPYLDTRPLSASPLAPGASADFRLIFDDINENWNQQLPGLQISQVATR